MKKEELKSIINSIKSWLNDDKIIYKFNGVVPTLWSKMYARSTKDGYAPERRWTSRPVSRILKEGGPTSPEGGPTFYAFIQRGGGSSTSFIYGENGKLYGIRAVKETASEASRKILRSFTQNIIKN